MNIKFSVRELTKKFEEVKKARQMNCSGFFALSAKGICPPDQSFDRLLTSAQEIEKLRKQYCQRFQ